MASIYRVVINEINSGKVVLPHHIYAVYESLTSQETKDAPIETVRDDNFINFQGSLVAGKDNSIDSGSFSSGFGQELNVSTDKSFVFGEEIVNLSVDKSLYLKNSTKGAFLKYARSKKTSPSTDHSSFSELFPCEIKSNTVNQVNLKCVAIEQNTDGESFYGVWKFKIMITENNGVLDVKVSNKEREIRADVQSNNFVDVRIKNQSVEVKDNRSSGNDIYWTCFFDITELDNT